MFPAKAPVTDEERQTDPFAGLRRLRRGLSRRRRRRLSKPLPEGEAGPRHRNPPAVRREPVALLRADRQHRRRPVLADAADLPAGGIRPRDPPRPAGSHAEADGSAQGERGLGAEAKALLDKVPGPEAMTKGKTCRRSPTSFGVSCSSASSPSIFRTALPARSVQRAHAPEEARPLVEDLCDALRSDARRGANISSAPRDRRRRARSARASARGSRTSAYATPFPSRSGPSLRRRSKALVADDIDGVESHRLDRHRGSVWIGKGESQAQWGLVEAGLGSSKAATTPSASLPTHARSLDALVGHYVGIAARGGPAAARVRAGDRGLHLRPTARCPTPSIMPQALREAGREGPVHCSPGTWKRPAGRRRAGWRTPTCSTDSSQPHAQGERTQRGLSSWWTPCATNSASPCTASSPRRSRPRSARPAPSFPTVTPVGMAWLLPGAGRGLRLCKDGRRLRRHAGRSQDRLGGQPNGGRCAPASATGSPRCRWTRSSSPRRSCRKRSSSWCCARSTSTATWRSTVRTLTTLSLIHQTLKSIRVAVHKLKRQGFADVVIATDHGFVLNAHAEAGDVCAKPPGTGSSCMTAPCSARAKPTRTISPCRREGRHPRRLLQARRPAEHGAVPQGTAVFPRRRLASGGGRSGDHGAG